MSAAGQPAKVKKRPITFALYGLTPQVEKAVGRAWSRTG